MKAEDRLEICLAAIEEVADKEGERAGGGEEDDEEDIGGGRDEIAGQLPPEDDEGVAHGRSAAPAQAWVTRRKTSSRRPRSTRISAIGHSFSRVICPTSSTMRSRLLAKAVSVLVLPSASTAATLERRCRAARIGPKSAPLTRRMVTAL